MGCITSTKSLICKHKQIVKQRMWYPGQKNKSHTNCILKTNRCKTKADQKPVLRLEVDSSRNGITFR